jgi:hypothetical protein
MSGYGNLRDLTCTFSQLCKPGSSAEEKRLFYRLPSNITTLGISVHCCDPTEPISFLSQIEEVLKPYRRVFTNLEVLRVSYGAGNPLLDELCQRAKVNLEYFKNSQSDAINTAVKLTFPNDEDSQDWLQRLILDWEHPQPPQLDMESSVAAEDSDIIILDEQLEP